MANETQSFSVPGVPEVESLSKQLNEIRSVGRTSLLRTLSIPFRFWSVRRATLDVAGSSRSAIIGLHLIQVAVFSCIVLTSAAISLRETHVVSAIYTLEYKYRTIDEVLNEWAAAPLMSPLFWVPFVSFFVLPVVAGFAAWVFLSNAHRSGPFVNAFGRSYRGVIACAGVFNLLLALAVSGVVWADSFDFDNTNWERRVIFDMLAMLGVQSCIFLLLVSLDRATLIAGEAIPADLPGPRCEGCGYDLTHLPAGGVCTECGLETEQSLTPGILRRTTAWQTRQTFSDWMATAGAALLTPRRFYWALFVRRPQAEASRFGRTQFIAMWIAAWLWMMAMGVSKNGFNRGYEFGLVPVLGASAVVVVGWFLHRLVGAIMFTYAGVRKLLDDGHWHRHVMMHEASFLWVFCALDGSLISSFILLDGPWISQALTGRQFYTILGIPLELLVVFGGNLLLIVFWFWRYAIAFERIRWNNF